MALKRINSNQYIKVALDGTFRIYHSTIERTKEKKAPSVEEVCLKYDTIILNLLQDRERYYYDPDFVTLIQEWEAEFEKYQRAALQGKKAKGFPLMKQYIKNIENSLPELICEGQVGVKGNTLEEVYNTVKQCGYFGDTEDC